MFLVFLIKNICLMAFYFAYATMIFIQPVHKSMIVVYFITLACFSLSYALRFNEKYNKFKYLPALGLVGAILYMRTITGAAAVIVPFIYMIYFIKNDKYYVAHYTFKDLFTKATIVMLAYMIFVYMINKLELFKTVGLQYAIVFIISGLYILRTTRHSKEVITNKKFIIMNILVIAVTFSICIILSSNIALNAVIYAIKYIYSNLIAPILLNILYIIFWPLMKVMSMYDVEKKEPEGTFGDGENIVEGEFIVRDIVNKNDGMFMILCIFIIALLLITIAVFLIKYILKQRKKLNIDLEGVIQYRSFLEDDIKANKKGKQLINNSINQIRYWYRKFLFLCHQRNMDIIKSDSSQSIYRKSCEIFVNYTQELESVKEIYRKARYSKEAINNQDVKEIKSIYKSLEKEKDYKIWIDQG